MKNDRLRVTLDDAYAKSLGVALFCFSRLEWDAVWCCEKMRPGYITNLGTKTAGRIALDLIDLARARSDWLLFEVRCNEFKKLVQIRNALMHGKPGSIGADQRLSDKGDVWTIEKVDEASDDFTACQILLNDFLHKALM